MRLRDIEQAWLLSAWSSITFILNVISQVWKMRLEFIATLKNMAELISNLLFIIEFGWNEKSDLLAVSS